MNATNNEQELRELDMWIAEHVMGWSNRRACFESEQRVFNPSTDPAVALQVLEKLCSLSTGEKPFSIILHNSGIGWMCGIQTGVEEWQEIEDVIAETLPLAICRFARALFQPPAKMTKV